MCIINNLYSVELLGSLYWRFVEVTCRTKERDKQVHIISQVFVPKFILGIRVPKYTFHILHYPIIICLLIRVIWEAIPMPKLLTWRPHSLVGTEYGSEHSLQPLDSPVAGKTSSFPVLEHWVSPRATKACVGLEKNPRTKYSCIEDGQKVASGGLYNTKSAILNSSLLHTGIINYIKIKNMQSVWPFMYRPPQLPQHQVFHWRGRLP